MMHFISVVSDQEESPELIKASEPTKTNLRLRFSPLLEKDCLVDASQHQVLTGHRLPMLRLQQIWDETRQGYTPPAKGSANLDRLGVTRHNSCQIEEFLRKYVLIFKLLNLFGNIKTKIQGMNSDTKKGEKSALFCK